MSKPNEYEIKEVADFLKVPEDRLDDCIDEFKECLKTTRESRATLKTLADIVDQDADVITKFCGFIWVDDGKTKQTIEITTEVDV